MLTRSYGELCDCVCAQHCVYVCFASYGLSAFTFVSDRGLMASMFVSDGGSLHLLSCRDGCLVRVCAPNFGNSWSWSRGGATPEVALDRQWSAFVGYQRVAVEGVKLFLLVLEP